MWDLEPRLTIRLGGLVAAGVAMLAVLDLILAIGAPVTKSSRARLHSVLTKALHILVIAESLDMAEQIYVGTEQGRLSA